MTDKKNTVVGKVQDVKFGENFKFQIKELPDVSAAFNLNKDAYNKMIENVLNQKIFSSFYDHNPSVYLGYGTYPNISLQYANPEPKPRKVAMIFGVTGQDGSYLSEILLEKEYEVIGIKRRSSVSNTSRIDHIVDNSFKLVEGDVTDAHSVSELIREYKPTHIFNLAAQSHVGTSFKQPVATWDSTATGCLNILNGILTVDKSIRFYQASTSEMFGKNYSENVVTSNWSQDTDKDGNLIEKVETVTYKYQDEETEFMPQSPYAVAKLAAHHMVRLYRDSYGLFACSGILFNHESPRRGENFVTRKITKYVGKLVNKLKDIDYFTDYDFDAIEFCKEELGALELGNLDAKRDWGFAKDYCEGMVRILEHERADDFVLATGETRSVRDFLEAAFGAYDLDYHDFVEINPEFVRPAEVDFLKGNATKAKEVLGWEPETNFGQLVNIMVEADRQNEMEKT